MLSVLGCPVNEALLAQWNHYFLCTAAPFFLSEDLVLPDEILVISRKAFSESGFELSYVDSYATYRVSRDAQRVAFLTPAEFDALDVPTQKALLAAQCELKRRQVYPWRQVKHYLEGCREQADTRCVEVGGETHFVLDSYIWGLMSDQTRRCWLIEFMSSDNTPACLSSSLTEAEWSQIPQASIRPLAGTFAAKSGANCFSTTLAAVTQNPATAETIADFWLHQEAFFHGLERRGYQLQADDPALDSTLSDAVLVWEDEQGVAQHACYVIGNGLVFNKNSQAWFAPRQLLRLDTLLDYWKDDPFKVVVYGRGTVGPKRKDERAKL